MMKKILLFLSVFFVSMSWAYATDTSQIKIQLAGNIKDNRYFLCLHNVGCLSIKAAKKGKIYPVFHEVEMDNIFVVNLANNRLYSQGLPESCNVTIKPHQTMTISGNFAEGANDSVNIKQLKCSVG